MTLKIFIRCILKKYDEEGGGGVTDFWSLWLLKRALEIQITDPMSPLWSIYNQPFYKKKLYATGV
jgi:hypothetical protein